MRLAIVEIAGVALADAARVLTDAGLKFEASLNHGMDSGTADVLRLVVRDEAGTILPQQCEPGQGWWMVSAVFNQETYGKQSIARLAAIQVVGKVEFGIDGSSKVTPQ